ncbi:MAG: type II toxin-antitoxin system RelE/ParE family toxin [Desulfofustis sp.]|nr:type II toxin-antitoxin system RelE/ParE family toxin [Desulfofustis sp.]
MKWHITFYSEKVEAETLSLPPGIVVNFLHIAELIEEFGASLGLPYTKALGDGLFEIRAKGKEGIGRSFFCTMKGQEIIILHSFIKKSQKTPKKELKTTQTRLKEIRKKK